MATPQILRQSCGRDLRTGAQDTLCQSSLCQGPSPAMLSVPSWGPLQPRPPLHLGAGPLSICDWVRAELVQCWSRCVDMLCNVYAILKVDGRVGLV